LTPKQAEILAFIEENGSPTFREIQKHFGFSSLGTVYSHVKALKKQKKLLDKKYARLQPKKEKDGATLLIPIIGEIKLGLPPKMWGESILYPIHKSLIVNENTAYFFLVKGDSFHSELIDDEDLIAVQAGVLPEDGDLVFALSGGSVLIRTYFKQGNKIRLESKQKEFQIFGKDRLEIQGVITAVIRPLI